MSGIHEHLPEFAPTAYLGDAAEAFANATRAVFPTVQMRLMCFAHVYKVSHDASIPIQVSGISIKKKLRSFVRS